jgi:FkbM family methyltransferase
MIPTCSIYDAGGCNFLLFDKDDIVSDALKNKVGHDPHIVEISAMFLDRYLQNSEDGCVLDIGSNVGSFCVPLAKKYPQFKFYAFEPQRVVFYQLCANILLNGCDNIFAKNFGLSDQVDTFDIQLPNYSTELNVGAFSLDAEVRKNDYECPSSGSTEAISIMPLDDLNIDNIKLIKIDVEGLELDVVKGALETLGNNNYPPIIFEAWANKEWYQPRRQELFDFIESLGYNIVNIGQDNIAQHKDNTVLNIKVN